MTLTSHLKLKNSPVRIFLHDRFPNTKIIINEIRAVGNAATTIRPETKVPWSLLGTAIDFRICGYFAPITFHGFPPLQEVWGDEDFMVFFMETIQQIESRAAELYSAGPSLKRIDEESLCRFCVVLAMFDHEFRSGMMPLEVSLLNPKFTTTEEFLSVIPQEWVDDLYQMSLVFRNTSVDLLSRPVVLNPHFEGSIDVGGADADLIIDSCLLEIKAAISFKVSRPEWIYQLLGYSFLDYSNSYTINTVGFYLARQGVYIRWSLEEIMEKLAGKEVPPLAELRLEFKSVISGAGLGVDRSILYRY
jgi:hypothetical protein